MPFLAFWHFLNLVKTTSRLLTQEHGEKKKKNSYFTTAYFVFSTSSWVTAGLVWFIMSGRGFYSQLPPTKTVTVFRNGDAFYPGRRFVISQRQSFTFDSFLNTVTRGITAPFGAVRNIYTPNKGHRVLGLEQLVHGERYVAAGAERLKQLE